MKNIVIILMSLVLTNISLPTATHHYVGHAEMPSLKIPSITNVIPEEISTGHTIENIPVKEENPQVKFKAKKTINAQSAKNVLNQTKHENLRASGNVVLSEKILFAFDAYELMHNDDFNRILQIADKLIFDTNMKISIAGNADNVGSDDYNDALSYNRAENVKTYLLELGVSADQIILSFNGEQNPAADNDTEEGRLLNRNVEMFLYQ